MRLARRPWFLLVLFGLLIAGSRYPMAPGQLFTFDDVNLAYSVGHFDIRESQPHPPGYPLFVLEMRVLYWLHVRRAETILLFLALAGSLVALYLLVAWGDRIMGGDSGYCAAWLLVFHPVFWHAGVTSALRVQLAIVSIGVGAACWRAWKGERRWVLWSALALGIGAGVRPETGPLLFPLWALSAWRAPATWKERGQALGAMAAVVLLWLLPAMIASGGPLTFMRANLDYIRDQGSVSSGLFGASDYKWLTTFWQLMTWVFCGVLGWALPAVLAWRRRQGWGFGWEQLTFLAVWFVPAFAFALAVHLEDPGQTLAMAVPVALAGGYLFNRALDTVDGRVSRWFALILVSATLAVAWATDRLDAPYMLIWIPAICLAAGLALKLAQAKNAGYPPRAHVMCLLLAPVVLLNLTMFNHRGWYYRGASIAGFRASAEHAVAAMNSGLALSSAEQIRNTLAIDDHIVRDVQRLSAERPEHTVVVWERGLTAWRKTAYYAPGVPIYVLEHKDLSAGALPVLALWKGSKLEGHMQGAAPLRVSLPAGVRIVWLLNSRTGLYQEARRVFGLKPAGSVDYTDLPVESGSRVLGEYEIAW